MVKRSRSKPSRHERKQQRVKSARATDHGLPAAFPRTRPSTPDPSAPLASVGPPSSDPGDLEPLSERSGPSLSRRIHDVSLPVKIAIVAAVVLAVVWVFAFTAGRDASRPAPASSVPAQPTASALPVVSTPPAASPTPSVSAAPPAVPTRRATAPRVTAEPVPAPVEEPPLRPAVTASASASTTKPARDVPPRATQNPGPPTSLSGTSKPLEPPPFVTPPPPAPPLPSTHPEPDPLDERAGHPDVGDP